MKNHKILFCAIGALVTLFAAVTAVIIFKNEIMDFFAELREKIEDKKASHCCEFSDYADM